MCRAPRGAHPQPRPPGRPGRSPGPALQPGGAVRSRSGVSLHRHVPAQQPRGRQRDAARLPVRQRGPGRPSSRVRPDGVRLRGPGHRPPDGDGSRRQPAFHVPGVPPGLRRRARPARRAGGLVRLARASRLRRPHRRGGRAGLGARPSRRARRVRLSERRGHRLAGAPGRAVVRPRQLLAPAPSVCGGRALVERLRPRCPRPGTVTSRARRAVLRSAGGGGRTRRRARPAGTAGAVPGHDLRRRPAAGARPRRAAGLWACGTTPSWS